MQKKREIPLFIINSDTNNTLCYFTGNGIELHAHMCMYICINKLIVIVQKSTYYLSMCK